LAYEAGKTHGRAPAPGHDYYTAVKDRTDGKIAALAQARRLIRQACHIPGRARRRRAHRHLTRAAPAVTINRDAPGPASRGRRHQMGHNRGQLPAAASGCSLPRRGTQTA